MQTREYSGPGQAMARLDAGTIAREVVLEGYSEGWMGGSHTVAEVKKILAPLGIRYVDDIRGRWEPTPPARPCTPERARLVALAVLEVALVYVESDEGKAVLVYADGGREAAAELVRVALDWFAESRGTS